MGSFFSSAAYAAPADDPNSAVVAVHSVDAFNQTLESHKNSNKLIVIDFSATWCGPCRFIEPHFKALAAKYAETAVFVKVDVDELSEVSAQHKVQAMPTFVLLKNGQELTRIVGAQKEELERKVAQFVK